MKKTAALFLALALCLTLAPTALAAGFTDVSSGDYYYIPVQWAVENDITSGTSATTFSPGQTCTVGQILTFLWRANGEPAPAGGNPFTDVKDTDYFASAACWAHEKGLVSGSEFHADAPCTRSMAVTYLWKLSGSPASSAGAAFTDVPADAVYAPAVAWAVEKEITSGTSATAFSPAQTCTRGQIVTFLYRFSGSPEVTLPAETASTYYASHPGVPDFGAFAGVPVSDSKVVENAYYYYYDAAAIAKNSGRALMEEFEELLTASGFSIFHSYYSDVGPVVIYANRDTIFSIGVDVDGGTIGVLVRPLSDLTSSVTSDDGKYYSQCPGVPDFGAIAGVMPTDVSPRSNGWTYTYSKAGLTEEDSTAYARALNAEGFQIVDAGSNGYGSNYLEVSNGSTSIIIVETEASIMVAVYN